MIRDGGMRGVTDALLVIGQNPAPSEPAAQALLQAMRVAAH